MNIEARIKVLNSFIGTEHHDAVTQALQAANGNFTAASESLKDKLPPESLQKLHIADLVSTAVGDQPKILDAIKGQTDIKTPRNLANLNVDELTKRLAPDASPDSKAHQEAKKQAEAINRQSFVREPLTVLQRMTREGDIPLDSDNVRNGLHSFLQTISPDTNIRLTPIHKVLTEDALKGVPVEHRSEVIDRAKALWRTTVIVPPDAPDAITHLIKNNLTSYFEISDKPESSFNRICYELDENVRSQTYTNAVNMRIGNEHAMMTIFEAVRGTGLAAIDGLHTLELGLNIFNETADKHDVQLNLDTLFGGMDYCECKECESVYSASAYFVELLNFLRNNNLDPDKANTKKGNTKDISGTPLVSLFQRRPDLGDLELSCENTDTELPYIDLVNEIMERYVVYKADYAAAKSNNENAFNVVRETTQELLAEPQHTNYLAYCYLKNNAYYPFNLPFHQPIETARIFLNYLGTSRYEVMDTFRSAHEVIPERETTPQQLPDTCACVDGKPPKNFCHKLPTLSLTKTDDPLIEKSHEEVLKRAVDAEFLGLTQEEYIILTKEAFWKKDYFEHTLGIDLKPENYQNNIGVQAPWIYYGYESEEAMLGKNDDSRTGHAGLSFVKNEFLPRTGLQYTDLVELLKTRFINPLYPKGMALELFENIRASYGYLKSLVKDDPRSTDKETKYKDLIDFLGQVTAWISVPAVLHTSAFGKFLTHSVETDSSIIRDWVYNCFEKLGKLIVLEAGEGPWLPIEGELQTPEGKTVGNLMSDGTIKNSDNKIIGNVSIVSGIYDNGKVSDNNKKILGWASDDDRAMLIDVKTVAIAGPVILIDGKKFQEEFGCNRLIIHNPNETIWLYGDRVIWRKECVVLWQSPRDTCNLEKVRLQHLDGSPVQSSEFDRMQRFTRLWRKLGWTMDELDKALEGLASRDTISGRPPKIIATPHIGFKDFKDSCSVEKFKPCCEYETETGGSITCDITVDFLHQLVAVKKLLEITKLPLIKLLCFWTNISTAGEKSLYSSLFLTHNLAKIDDVFQEDVNGNFLAQSEKITDHLPVLMAALKLKADDITAIIKESNAPLTLENVTKIYRNGLLAKALHIRVSDLQDFKALFGEPFINVKTKFPDAHTTLELFETWKKMEDSGFTFRQLAYVIKGKDLDDPLKPLAPSQKTLLQIAKTLYDGLVAIDEDNPYVTDVQQATSELVRAKAGMLFEPDVVEKVMGLLEGTTVYTTNAPPDQDITVPESLAGKIRYTNRKDLDEHQAVLQVTGILSDDDKDSAEKLCADSDWKPAFDRIDKQKQNLFKDALADLIPQDKLDDIKTQLLQPDVLDNDDPSKITAPQKRLVFLQFFLPFLHIQLKHKFVVGTIAEFVALPRNVAESLISNKVLTGATDKEAAEDVLLRIQNAPAGAAPSWYLIAPEQGDYSFAAIGAAKPGGGYVQPADIKVNGVALSFTPQEDPSNFFYTAPVSKTDLGVLKKEQLYKLEVTDRQPLELQWKKAGTSWLSIPTSALLPDHFSGDDADARAFNDVFVKLSRAAILINIFNLSADEVLYFQVNGKDFGPDQQPFDFNALELEPWKRIADYALLRKSLPKAGSPLLDLFAWAHNPDDWNSIPDEKEKLDQLVEKLDAVTKWGKERISALLTANHFDLVRPEAFCDETNLIKLQKAISVADKVGVDTDSLFYWAVPGSKFWPCHAIAMDIRMAMHARFNAEDWEQAVKPLNDRLREMQKQALITYLLTLPELQAWPVIDADSLFEYFLIDVQMGTDRQSSRMVQAIASVQLFIKRCLMGLEEKYGVSVDAIDRDRWAWMQKYRVWEANRKVFLYPENWIRPELRDDKSPFYKELESELLQKDVNPQTVADALKNYLYKVDEVANLIVVGLYIEPAKDKDGEDIKGEYLKLHIFARTRNAPYFFFYRYFDIGQRNWYPWEKMQVDIPSYDVEEVDANGNKTGKNGTYVIPVVFNNTLLVFFPQFMKKTKASESSTQITTNQDDDGNTKIPVNKPVEFWELKMAWSEYRNGKWSQKQVSAEAVYDLSIPDPAQPNKLTVFPDISSYTFVPIVTPDSVNIEIYYTQPPTTIEIGTTTKESPKLSSVKICFQTVDDNKDDDITYSVSIRDKDGHEFAKLENGGDGITYDDPGTVDETTYIKEKLAIPPFQILDPTINKSRCRGFNAVITDTGPSDNGWHFNATVSLIFEDNTELTASNSTQINFQHRNNSVTLRQQ